MEDRLKLIYEKKIEEHLLLKHEELNFLELRLVFEQEIENKLLSLYVVSFSDEYDCKESFYVKVISNFLKDEHSSDFMEVNKFEFFKTLVEQAGVHYGKDIA